MSESDGERAARSVALEQAYVHEVYEQCAEKTAQSKHWPRIYKFLEELEPGALVCDIGCGNGKYLSVNDNVFKVGADRCKRLTDIAREKENEVMICDNLALPFRDESFDAVLSIAVVHHFATTERRVNALKELARVLRIGGRLVISVWAMEQRHRKFESQDVLVPWPKAYCLNSGSRTTRTCCTGDSTVNSLDDVINDLDPDRIAQRYLVTSGKRGGGDGPRCKNRSYWIDPIFSPSPSTSSLSSPNETCYSFFRRALQKLAGGKRGSAGNRAWFLETWQSGGCKNRRQRRNFQQDDIGDVDDIPIELRRLEDDNVTLIKHPVPPAQGSAETLGVKSKSLGDILEIQRLDLVRSRSSIPGFSSTLTSESYLDEESKTPSPQPPPESTKDLRKGFAEIDSTTAALVSSISISSTSFTRSSSITSGNKPRLVKQKTHLQDDSPLEFIDEPPTAVIKDLAEFQDAQRLGPASRRRRRGNVHKQSSMNEELMSMERLAERDRVRKNIMKQTSLNEEIICKPSGQTFCHFRDTLYSGNATKRLQLIKSDLTNRIKQSTTSMENKVSSMAIKNGFAKILQGWKQSAESEGNSENHEPEIADCGVVTSGNDDSKTATSGKTSAVGAVSGSGQAAAVANKTPAVEGGESIERRLSKEDGSDSSKDSSLQSDTSVDSEDSFASVIYVPKNQQQRDNNQQQNNKHHYHHPYNYHRKDSTGSPHNNQFPSLIDVTTTIPPAVVGGYHQLRTTSAPPSPRIKHPPDFHHGGVGPRLKLITMSPLLKQFPATSKSLPPPSPPGLSPRNFNPSFILPTTTEPFIPVSDFFPTVPTEQSPTAAAATATTTTTTTTTTTMIDRENNDNIDNNEFTKSPETDNEQVVANAGSSDSSSPPIVPEVTTMSDVVVVVDEEQNCERESERIDSTSNESINDQDVRRSKLNQIKELLRQKPGFATRSIKSSFPLVRRASTLTGRSENAGPDARTLPRLLSLELFNPETDDLDSDSSGISSPESVGSVISVISDQRFSLKNKRDAAKSEKPTVAVENASCINENADEKNNKQKESIDVRNEDDGTNSIGIDVTDKLGVNLMNDIEQYCRQQSASRATISTTANNEYAVRSIPPYVASETIDLSSRINGSSSSSLRSNCKYSQLVDDTIAWLSGATAGSPDNHYSQEYVRADNNENSIVDTSSDGFERHTPFLLPKSISEEVIDDFVVVTKSGECLVVDEIKREKNQESTNSVNAGKQKPRVDSIDNSISLLSDASQTDDSIDASRCLSREEGSTISLGSSSNLEYKTLRERRKYLYKKRSASEEIPRSAAGAVVATATIGDVAGKVVNNNDGALPISGAAGRRPSTSDIPLSGSSSQESLPSDRGGGDEGGGGGAITYHQYYHVFREGELDQLINKYVENLHIISSYYDHASWCIVAEKVQVWTI